MLNKITCLDIEPPCNHGDVRLVDGRNQFNGRVEVCAFGVWGTVCDDSWDIRDAQVVCHQLGYICKYIGNIINIVILSCPVAGISMDNNVKSDDSSQPIHLDDVNCNGTETSLLNCSHQGIGRHNCVHSEDAGVICSGMCIFV